MTFDDFDTRFQVAFQELSCGGFSVVGEEETGSDMPDPVQAKAACEEVLTTLFHVFGDTRLERDVKEIAWKIVNAFHTQHGALEKRLDKVQMEMKDLLLQNDTSEIGTVELEEQTDQCRSSEEASEAIACCRDFMAQVFAANTGQAWTPRSGSVISGGRSASQIEAREFEAARTAKQRQKKAPDGIVVGFCGSDPWDDVDAIFEMLDRAKTRHPNMVLAYTGQRKGSDVVAATWADKNGVDLVKYAPDFKRHGNRAGFVRNDRMIDLNPVAMIVCEGSGIQANMAQKSRAKNIPVVFMKRTVAKAEDNLIAA
ncbi:MAG: DUF2493 domain-containing protein [Pseudomonadota bacterium]